MSKRILFLEPYYGGSHQSWFEQLKRYSKHSYEAITLPAKHWKWRMSSSASVFKDKLDQYQPADFDFILCSEFLSINRLRGELSQQWRNLPIACYFHENQILYPWSQHDKDSEYERNIHYIYHHLENLKNADVLFFNSLFHMSSLYEHLNPLIKKLPSPKPNFDTDKMKKKSKVLYQGIDPHIIKGNQRNPNDPPLILWNHRWDEDKNPEDFFLLISKLLKENFLFELALLGDIQRTKYWEKFQKLCPERIRYSGKLPREEYLNVLNSAAIAPITSFHDFFGISAVEAILCGVQVFVPQRMAYHEHFTPEDYQNYSYQDPAELLQKVLHYQQFGCQNSIKLCKRYLWNELILEYDSQFDMVESLKI